MSEVAKDAAAIVLKCDGEPWFYVGRTLNGRIIWGERANAKVFTGDAADAVVAVAAAYGDTLAVEAEVA